MLAVSFFCDALGHQHHKIMHILTHPIQLRHSRRTPQPIPIPASKHPLHRHGLHPNRNTLLPAHPRRPTLPLPRQQHPKRPHILNLHILRELRRMEPPHPEQPERLRLRRRPLQLLQRLQHYVFERRGPGELPEPDF